MLRMRRRAALGLVTYVIEPLYETRVGMVGYNDSINVNLQRRDLARGVLTGCIDDVQHSGDAGVCEPRRTPACPASAFALISEYAQRTGSTSLSGCSALGQEIGWTASARVP
jgi:hypothetical protein